MAATIIPLSKSKIIRNFIICLCFITTSVWLLTLKPSVHNVFLAPVIRYAIAPAGILIFGTFAVVYVRIFTSTKPGFIVAENGITDNSTAVAAGFIPWKDIESLATVRRTGQTFIALYLRDPEMYLNRGNFLARQAMRSNFRKYGTPFLLTPVVLKCEVNELFNLLEQGLDAYSHQSNPTDKALQELYGELVAAGCNRFCIVGVGKQLDDDVERLELVGGKWQVYYMERGQKGQVLYENINKEEAINYYRKHILNMQHWHLVVSTRSEQKLTQYRDAVQNMGIAPIQNDIPDYSGTGDRVYRLFVVNREIFTVKENLGEVPYYDSDLKPKL